ncbi:hypothetical protein BDN71DRAFT_1497446 [Pleurotus eryngii]|uniref:Uncharacterized protein n=1 Tax=Pleurotus eryngii TaxID=5323 RepID=A0A9P5ZTS2_PLEER|nr:hypothetical protein BDN71DRAFT_1497446 [Pleurotus eryngii]
MSSTHLHKDQNMLDFLESQTSLETLHLTRSRHLENKPEFSSTSFPNLKALFVHCSLVHPFLRTSARLERLCVTGRAYLPNSRPGNTIYTDSIRTLSCLRLSGAEVAISVASLFPNLEWLSGPITTANLDDLRTHNRKLRGILLTGPAYAGFLQDEAKQFFDTIPTLQFVEYSQSHNRLYRGAAASTSVRWLCELGEEWLADWVEDVVHVECRWADPTDGDLTIAWVLSAYQGNYDPLGTGYAPLLAYFGIAETLTSEPSTKSCASSLPFACREQIRFGGAVVEQEIPSSSRRAIRRGSTQYRKTHQIEKLGGRMGNTGIFESLVTSEATPPSLMGTFVEATVDHGCHKVSLLSQHEDAPSSHKFGNDFQRAPLTSMETFQTFFVLLLPSPVLINTTMTRGCRSNTDVQGAQIPNHVSVSRLPKGSMKALVVRLSYMCISSPKEPSSVPVGDENVEDERDWIGSWPEPNRRAIIMHTTIPDDDNGLPRKASDLIDQLTLGGFTALGSPYLRRMERRGADELDVDIVPGWPIKILCSPCL